jgi:outer membrane protein OmpA-like peptidoglycan-associated protein
MKKTLTVGLLMMIATLVLGQNKKSFNAFGKKMNRSYKCAHVGIQKIKKGKFKKKAVAEIRETYYNALALISADNNIKPATIEETNYELHSTVHNNVISHTPDLPLPTPVYFRFDTDELTYSDLRQIALAVEHAKLGKHILLEGHTDYS